jgi:hypothetical protein
LRRAHARSHATALGLDRKVELISAGFLEGRASVVWLEQRKPGYGV